MAVLVEADYANFKVPAFKATGATYQVPTPSAMEGLLKGIFWKPEMRYEIEEIVVFNPIEYTTIKYNELKNKIPFNNVVEAMKGKGENNLFMDNSSHIFRLHLLLKNVRYAVKFRIHPTRKFLDTIPQDLSAEELEKVMTQFYGKYYGTIKYRFEHGKTFKSLYLGCREYAVKHIELRDEIPYDEVDESLKGEKDLGYMLYGINWDMDSRLAKLPIYYHPIMRDGIINVKESVGTCVC